MLDISCPLHCTLDVEGVYGNIQSGWKYSIYTYKVNNIVEEFVSDIANKYRGFIKGSNWHGQDSPGNLTGERAKIDNQKYLWFFENPRRNLLGRHMVD